MNTHDPHSFRIHGGCRKAPSRLHDLWSQCLDVVAWGYVTFIFLCLIVIFLGVG